MHTRCVLNTSECMLIERSLIISEIWQESTMEHWDGSLAGVNCNYITTKEHEWVLSGGWTESLARTP